MTWVADVFAFPGLEDVLDVAASGNPDTPFNPNKPKDYANDISIGLGIPPNYWTQDEARYAEVSDRNAIWNGHLLSDWLDACTSNPSAIDITVGDTSMTRDAIRSHIRNTIPFFAQTPALHWVDASQQGIIQNVAKDICTNAATAWMEHHPGESPTTVAEALEMHLLGNTRWQSFTAQRNIFLETYDGSGAVAGGPGTVPLPFVAGGPWSETAFRGKAFELEPVLRAGFGPAVRPGLGGYIVDHPHRYATIHVIDIDGNVRFSTTDFSLQKVSKQVGEKFQAISTWDGPQLVFRCEKGSIYQLGFTMLKTKNFDWLRAFQMNWTRYFKGSALASNQSRLYVLYGATLLGGYPIGMSISETTTAEPLAELVIQMYITDDVPLPDMTIINATNGEYTWEGDTFVVESGVSNLDGYVRQASPTIDSTNSTFGADIVPTTGEGLA